MERDRCHRRVHRSLSRPPEQPRRDVPRRPALLAMGVVSAAAADRQLARDTTRGAVRCQSIRRLTEKTHRRLISPDEGAAGGLPDEGIEGDEDRGGEGDAGPASGSSGPGSGG